MKNLVVATYEAFNQRRYGNPWIAKVGPNGKPSFEKKVGSYTGTYGRGESGELYIFEPEEGAIYAYGQKDYRGTGAPIRYIQIRDGAPVAIERGELLDLLR